VAFFISATADEKTFCDAPSSLLAIHCIERGAKSCSELDGIVLRPEVHEEQSRRLDEHVVVKCGNRDAIPS
jgi:hypothetical protein